MKTMTKAFGEIEISEDKTILFKNGIIGFPELTRFTLLHNEEHGKEAGIHWLQSLEEPEFALPVIDPLLILPTYNPEIEEELLKPLGDLTGENLLVMVTATIPADLTKMTVNLQGPVIINVETRNACQVIVEGAENVVKFPVYDILQQRKAGE